MNAILQFEPIYQERVWGGRGFATQLGRVLPEGEPLGESWEMVDRPEAQSVVSDGTWTGLTLRQLIETHGATVMGPNWTAERPFPILVKWLDCNDRLSLQVHPPASVASGLGGEPKTENWYVAHAQPGAAVLAGLKPGVDGTAFRAALQEGTAESLVNRLPTVAGDSLLIHSGVMHAIDAGNLILEIQENSDTTYRVYDWGRVGLDGQPRALHIEQSMASLEANTAPAPQLVRSDEAITVLADCAEFRITRHRVPSGGTLVFQANEQARIVSVVQGALRSADGTAIPSGANALLPYAGEYLFTASADCVALVTDGFSG